MAPGQETGLTHLNYDLKGSNCKEILIRLELLQSIQPLGFNADEPVYLLSRNKSKANALSF
jgi:hypothetical protein